MTSPLCSEGSEGAGFFLGPVHTEIRMDLPKGLLFDGHVVLAEPEVSMKSSRLNWDRDEVVAPPLNL